MDRLQALTDPLGARTEYEYTYWGARRRILHPDLSELAFEYDPRQRLSGIRDENGFLWQLTLNDERIPTALTLPTGDQFLFSSSELGYLTGLTDATGNQYQFQRDSMERIRLDHRTRIAPVGYPERL